MPTGLRIICAFCLMTSAGVRTRHDASSAMDEAAESINGCGTWGRCDPFRIGLILLKPLLRASYVVKNIAAIVRQYMCSNQRVEAYRKAK